MPTGVLLQHIYLSLAYLMFLDTIIQEKQQQILVENGIMPFVELNAE